MKIQPCLYCGGNLRLVLPEMGGFLLRCDKCKGESGLCASSDEAVAHIEAHNRLSRIVQAGEALVASQRDGLSEEYIANLERLFKAVEDEAPDA